MGQHSYCHMGGGRITRYEARKLEIEKMLFVSVFSYVYIIYNIYIYVHTYQFLNLFLLNLLRWHWLIKSIRFQMYNSIIDHLYITSCAHHPKSNLQSPHIWIPLLFYLLPSHFKDGLSPPQFLEPPQRGGTEPSSCTWSLGHI